MLEITESARAKVLEFINSEPDEEQGGFALRIVGRPAGEFEFGLVPASDKAEDDVVVDANGFEVLIDESTAPQLDEARFEFVEDGDDSGFRIVGFGRSWSENPLAQKVQEVIDSRINPAVSSHGGHVTLLDVAETRAYIRLGGGCQGCGMANVTLKQGIEVMIREAVPEIDEIIDATDHAGGTNPYYSPGKGAGASPVG